MSENLEKFKWIDLIHPNGHMSKGYFSENKALIEKCQSLYPFSINDITSVGHNLYVLYNNTAMSILLQKLTKERDGTLKIKEAMRAAKRRRLDEDGGHNGGQFDVRDAIVLDEDFVNEGTASIQDLLSPGQPNSTFH